MCLFKDQPQRWGWKWRIIPAISGEGERLHPCGSWLLFAEWGRLCSQSRSLSATAFEYGIVALVFIRGQTISSPAKIKFHLGMRTDWRVGCNGSRTENRCGWTIMRHP